MTAPASAAHRSPLTVAAPAAPGGRPAHMDGTYVLLGSFRVFGFKYGYLLPIFCIECGAVLNGFGKVECVGCRSLFMVRHIISDVASIFFKTENDTVLVSPVKESRSYFPKSNPELIEWVEDDSVDTKSDSPLINDTYCLVCHLPLQHTLSVRVQKLIFKEYDDVEVIGVTEVTVVKSRPSYRIGRAHKECALLEESKPFGMRMVEPRTIPDKRQKSQGALENPTTKYGNPRHETLSDIAEVVDWE